MRVLISGSSGLIGTALVPHLRSAGHEVVRLVRRTPQAPDERGWDPPSGRIDDEALDGVDAVINLSGAGIADKRWTGARKQELRDSRLVPTDVLARAVAAHHIPVLINGSAVGYYGDTGAVAVDESGARGRGFLADLVRDWENATAPAAEAGARVVTIRTGLVLSPAGGLMGIMRPVVKFGLGGRLGSGEQYWPWISLDDEVGAITWALEHDTVVGPLNASGPAPVTCREFIKVMSSIVHRPAPWIVPGFAMRAVLGEFADEGVLVSQRVLPGVLEREGYGFSHTTVQAALSAVLDG